MTRLAGELDAMAKNQNNDVIQIKMDGGKF
jgi:hypothetical protein